MLRSDYMKLTRILSISLIAYSLFGQKALSQQVNCCGFSERQARLVNSNILSLYCLKKFNNPYLPKFRRILVKTLSKEGVSTLQFDQQQKEYFTDSLVLDLLAAKKWNGGCKGISDEWGKILR